MSTGLVPTPMFSATVKGGLEEVSTHYSVPPHMHFPSMLVQKFNSGRQSGGTMLIQRSDISRVAHGGEVRQQKNAATLFSDTRGRPEGFRVRSSYSPRPNLAILYIQSGATVDSALHARRIGMLFANPDWSCQERKNRRQRRRISQSQITVMERRLTP